MLRHPFKLVVAAATFALLFVSGVFADVKPSTLFSDHMVLQRGMTVPIWGTADEGEKVTVSFEGQEASTTAKEGRWSVSLKDLKTGGPFTLSISGKNKIQFKDVLVGDVWVCSGQSNMAWLVRNSDNAESAIAGSANPNIRLFSVPRKGAAEPQRTVDGSWQECGPRTIANFSAVGYFFGKDLEEALNIPIGLINSSYGGTPAEAWAAPGSLEAVSSLKNYVDEDAVRMKNFPKAMEDYQAKLAGLRNETKAAKIAGKRARQAPRPPIGPDSPGRMNALYNAMIAPLQPFAIKGAIWYQGESNAPRAAQYEALLSTMIQSWRQTWKQGDFPFLIVQLAPFRAISHQPMESDWAELREAQRLTTHSVPKTGMAVITDVGDQADIHPKRKAPVGSRLALAARKIAYGEDLVYSGPEYKEMTIDGKRAVLSFDHVGSGLAAKGGQVKGFTIAGADRKFFNAEAKIEGDKVIVSSPQVEKPVAVRFGWANFPVVDFWNKEGLPATPFRTDDFPLITQPKK